MAARGARPDEVEAQYATFDSPTNRARQRVRQRAHRRLAERHRAEFERYVDEERAAENLPPCAPALAICAACPVCEPCGRFGWNQPGVYGGLVEPERSARRLAARRREQRRRDAKRDVA